MKKYNVGDWVFGNVLGFSYYNFSKHPVKILSIKGDYFYYDKSSDITSGFPSGTKSISKYNFSEIVRKANYNEIPNNELNYEIY